MDFLLEQWGPTESCGYHLRVCDRIPPTTAGWGREAGVGAAERCGMAFLRFGALRAGWPEGAPSAAPSPGPGVSSGGPGCLSLLIQEACLLGPLQAESPEFSPKDLVTWGLFRPLRPPCPPRLPSAVHSVYQWDLWAAVCRAPRCPGLCGYSRQQDRVPAHHSVPGRCQGKQAVTALRASVGELFGPSRERGGRPREEPEAQMGEGAVPG